MSLTPEALRGYILEEVLAYLIRNTGYRLLVDATQDPEELDWKHNGLVVRGRGSVHQVDVLGELRWIPAFTYPLRLFVEAKFRRSRTSVGVVRSMVGTLLDVNQSNLPQVDRRNGNVPQIRPKYHYAGAIFSTSGFSRDAMDMALAHGVSLIDLGAQEFAALRDAIDHTARDLVGEGQAERTDREDDFGASVSGSRFLLAVRTALRRELDTFTAAPRQEVVSLTEDLVSGVAPAVSAARDFGELFVGMGRGPYMLVLKADNPAAFLQFAEQQPTHDVAIHWSENVDDGRTWWIEPAHRGDAYRLTFRLPEVLGDAIFSAQNVAKTALDMKRQHLSEITIFRHNPQRDSLIRLHFNPETIRAPRTHTHRVEDA